MPDQWQVTQVIETGDTSGRIEAWEITISRPADGESVSLWLPKMAIENTAVAYGLTSADEAIDVILHQTMLPIYAPDDQEPNPWQVAGEQARATVLERVERCKRDHATVTTAVPKGRTSAARKAADVLAPLRSHVRIDSVKCAAARLEQQRALLRAGA
ncbi:hypothetical protein HNP84_009758 [Thermocatellispora tengchongensis]|uniref:Uncharacterized protein n=1 Tax=Thermocatellispora tengchongensis TaxID=1073253 RepID=A0A840PPK4_9ACTN|nr:hypothetical protein [Thermocatellispora tengchongensis]MBB5139993.1 hypothetical protein [Thermocatellispora tengchongensis]